MVGLSVATVSATGPSCTVRHHCSGPWWHVEVSVLSVSPSYPTVCIQANWHHQVDEVGPVLMPDKQEGKDAVATAVLDSRFTFVGATQ
jgi:hypothetical protein